MSESPRRPDDTGTHTSLLDLLRAGNPAGWERALRLYQPFLRHWAQRFGIPPQDFEDISQAVFQVVVKRIGAFQLGEQKGSFRAWLREITRNVCHEHLRREKPSDRGVGGTDAAVKIQEIPDCDPGQTDPPELVSNLLREVIRLVRGEFSDEDWRVFERLTFDACSPADVARESGRNPATVRKVKSRIYRRLREELGDLLESDPPRDKAASPSGEIEPGRSPAGSD